MKYQDGVLLLDRREVMTVMNRVSNRYRRQAARCLK